MDVCKRYMQHEQQTFEQVVQARSAIDRREVYNDAVNSLNVRIETFPDELVAAFAK